MSARDLTIRTDDRGIRVEALVCPTCHDTRSVRTECVVWRRFRGEHDRSECPICAEAAGGIS